MSRASTGTAWVGLDNYVRLYHAIANFDGMLQEALRPGEAAVDTAMKDELTYHKWMQVMELFNDKAWVTRSLYLPSLHPDFEKVKELKCLVRANSGRDLYDIFHKAKNQMQALRTWCLNDKLVNSTERKNMTAISLMKSNKKDETFSSMSAFPSHLLYLWHTDDTYKSLDRLYTLPQVVRRDGNGAPPEEQDIAASTVRKGKTAIVMLQNAEAHHLQLANNFGYCLSKLNTIGGVHHDILQNITNDLAERVDAAHKRVLNLETAISES